jgi:hypothetical protein
VRGTAIFIIITITILIIIVITIVITIIIIIIFINAPPPRARMPARTRVLDLGVERRGLHALDVGADSFSVYLLPPQAFSAERQVLYRYPLPLTPALLLLCAYLLTVPPPGPLCVQGGKRGGFRGDAQGQFSGLWRVPLRRAAPEGTRRRVQRGRTGPGSEGTEPASTHNDEGEVRLCPLPHPPPKHTHTHTQRRGTHTPTV